MCKLQQEVEKEKQHNLAIYGLLVRILSKAGKMKEHAIDVSTKRDYKQQLPRKNHQGHRTTGTNVHKHPINLPVVTIVRISGTWQGGSSLISYMDAIGMHMAQLQYHDEMTDHISEKLIQYQYYFVSFVNKKVFLG